MRIDLIHKGKALRCINHQGDTYIKAPKKGQYKLKLYNNSNRRRLAVITVDGINVITGEDGNPDDSGYVMEAGEVMEIPGWRRSDSQVAAFTFKKREESYAPAIGKGVNNVGVIGIALFDEKVKPVIQPITITTCRCPTGHHTHHHHHYDWGIPISTGGFTYGGGGGTYGSSGTSGINAPIIGTNIFNTSTSDAAMEELSVNTVTTASVEPGSYEETTSLNFADDTLYERERSRSPRRRRRGKKRGGQGTNSPTRSVQTEAPKDVGTGYGHKLTFNTRDTTFERATTEPAEIFVLRYATKERLKSWGVPIQKMARPEPVPATTAQHVPAPSGWRG